MLAGGGGGSGPVARWLGELEGVDLWHVGWGSWREWTCGMLAGGSGLVGSIKLSPPMICKAVPIY